MRKNWEEYFLYDNKMELISDKPQYRLVCGSIVALIKKKERDWDYEVKLIEDKESYYDSYINIEKGTTDNFNEAELRVFNLISKLNIDTENFMLKMDYGL